MFLSTQDKFPNTFSVLFIQGFRVSSKQKSVCFLSLPYYTASQLTCSSSLQVTREISEKPGGFHCFNIAC